MEEKIKEIAQWVINNRYPKSEKEKISDHEMFNELVDKISSLLRPSEVSEGDRTSYFVKELKNNINNNLQYRDRDWFDLGINYALSFNGDECVKFGEFILDYITKKTDDVGYWIILPDDNLRVRECETIEQLFTGPYQEYKLKQQKQNG